MHVPHMSVPPQPSGSAPQVLFCALHVVGMQPHTFAVPPPPQVAGAAHGLQKAVWPPQPSL